ncbi:hypothetical protein AJ85_17210 [Alkalihalobacillus alcalophilus ATCC 27647 = CGMCC 1.3604]|uniref:Uncharacterized protein n=1 Tax=Alkalihalobacillus alcalophilus ATCC 27647 = CGMCC 1.3604 TaxID=1218173 RepID=A0A094XAR4_ALKAL|nr:hypothetical protein [Alkalihalobacillus alcalophilus]KGA95865.1 hypothetical protein BALCAV_0219785 [Alkalihalobacillus alcalophilus ATCC 27647 = CGMCC 1.3604]MED1563968.1 hypothetical protein [Alkalihalobacillus alcalophilus]THG92101.1 hypothetical protein AJ85_17210 [Alkalihalobacillus alcalophilus ATCC 27647 = CGMCC 1.3604]
MKNQFIKAALSLILFIFMFHSTGYANSSWQWLTSSPKEMLPLAIILTLCFEIISILFLGKLVKNYSIKVIAALIITLANIVSFLFPYIFRAIEFQAVSGGWAYAWYDAFAAGPYYIVLTGYLFLTLCIEVPIIYFLLKNYSKSRRFLLGVVISVNVMTTLIVAIMERIMFYGHW